MLYREPRLSDFVGRVFVLQAVEVGVGRFNQRPESLKSNRPRLWFIVFRAARPTDTDIRLFVTEEGLPLRHPFWICHEVRSTGEVFILAPIELGESPTRHPSVKLVISQPVRRVAPGAVHRDMRE